MSIAVAAQALHGCGGGSARSAAATPPAQVAQNTNEQAARPGPDAAPPTNADDPQTARPDATLAESVLVLHALEGDGPKLQTLFAAELPEPAHWEVEVAPSSVVLGELASLPYLGGAESEQLGRTSHSASLLAALQKLTNRMDASCKPSNASPCASLSWETRFSILISYARAEWERGEQTVDNGPLVRSADALRRAAGVVPIAVPSRRASAELLQALVLYTLGSYSGEPQALRASVDATQHALAIFKRDRYPEEWAECQYALGLATKELGILEGSSHRFDQAIAAHQASLSVQTKERAPFSWASSQAALGSALLMRGDGRGGDERFSSALAAEERALEVFTSQRAPLSFANTQKIRAAVLVALGRQESALDVLGDAVRACEAGSSVPLRQVRPLLWAELHLNLGSALHASAELNGDSERSRQALVAVQKTLEVFRRESTPRLWAAAQSSLGAALTQMGRERADEVLEKAIDAYGAALGVHTRRHAPRNWAATQNNLGIALSALGHRQRRRLRVGDAERSYDRARVAFQAALEVYTRRDLPLLWAQAQSNLAHALSGLGELTRRDRIQQALSTINLALEVRTRERFPVDWATSQSVLADALVNLSDAVKKPAPTLERAIISYRGAVEEESKHGLARREASSRANLGYALGLLAWAKQSPHCEALAELGQAEAAARPYPSLAAQIEPMIAEELATQPRPSAALCPDIAATWWDAHQK